MLTFPFGGRRSVVGGLRAAVLVGLMASESAAFAAENPAGRPPLDWSGWASVRQFEGTVTLSYRQEHEERSTLSTQSGQSWESVSLRFTLERDPDDTEGNTRAWRCIRMRAEVSGSSWMHRVSTDETFWRTAESFGYKGDLDQSQEMTLWLDVETGRWRLATPNRTAQPYQVAVSGVAKHASWKPAETSASSESRTLIEVGNFNGSAEKTVGGLQASKVIDMSVNLPNGSSPGFREQRLLLRPIMDDYELEVTIADYAKWRPRGTVAAPDKPGNNLTAKATVMRKGGGGPPAIVSSIQFALLDTSREPGVCLNWPLGAKDRNPDLKLGLPPLCPGTLSKEDQRFEVTSPLADEQGRPYALAQIDSYDFGGRSSLYVTCKLADGRELVGELKGESGEPGQDLIRLPKMDGPGWIAEAWKKEKGVAGLGDDDDSEKVEDQEDNGDGYTLYEEYRGWVENGQHLEGDPKAKDFFVLNLIGADARPGIALFEQVSALRVHSKLRRSEMSQTARLMNGNRRDAPHRVDQHGVWVKTFTLAGLGDTGAATPMTKRGVAGRPGITKGVGILARGDAQSAFNKPYNLPAQDAIFAYDRAIAHELLHSVGVEHHGDGDEQLSVWWVSPRHPRNKIGRPYFRGSSNAWGGRDDVYTLLNEKGRGLGDEVHGELCVRPEGHRGFLWGADQGRGPRLREEIRRGHGKPQVQDCGGILRLHAGG
ncbi:MAG: hypothetical protein Q8N18_00165 [Opitutaceae bacterium]|nr:hypothetical protein [Opitutaceae bacterium]